MRIAYIHQYFRRPSDVGSSRSYQQALAMVKSGHEVHMVTSDSLGIYDGKYSENVDGIHVHWIPGMYSNSMTHAERIAAFVRFAYRATVMVRKLNPDLVFATSTPLTVVIPGLVGSVFPKRPFVFEVRDLWPELPIAMGVLRNRVLQKCAFALEMLAYRRADEVIALSPGMAESIVRRTGGRTSVTIVPNGADVELFDVDQEEAKAWWSSFSGLEPGVKAAVYAGTLGRANRAGVLVEVAAHLQEISTTEQIAIVVVGDGAERADIEELARSRGVLGINFFMFSSVPKSLMGNVYAAADCILSVLAPIKMLETSSPNKVFDAFAAGRPVVTNYGGWIADLLESHQAGFALPSASSEEIAEAIARVVSRSPNRSSLRSAARALGRGQFDRTSLVATVLSVVESAGRRYSESKC